VCPLPCVSGGAGIPKREMREEKAGTGLGAALGSIQSGPPGLTTEPSLEGEVGFAWSCHLPSQFAKGGCSSCRRCRPAF
jgi:hypothetical protein